MLKLALPALLAALSLPAMAQDTTPSAKVLKAEPQPIRDLEDEDKLLNFEIQDLKAGEAKAKDLEATDGETADLEAEDKMMNFEVQD